MVFSNITVSPRSREKTAIPTSAMAWHRISSIILSTPYLSPGMEIVLTDHWSFLGTLGRLDYDSFTKSFGFSVDGSAFSAGLYYNF